MFQRALFLALKPIMEFLEKDLEQIIFESSSEDLWDRDLWVRGLRLRQLKIGNYGRADLVTIERPFYHPVWESMCRGVITIYELKKDDISPSTLFQAIRYAKGIQSWVEKHKPKLAGYIDYRIILVGKRSTGDICYMSDFFSPDLSERNEDEAPLTSVHCYEYKYKLDGIYFHELSGYQLKDEGF